MHLDARTLLAQITGPALVADIPTHLDLREAGIGSGDIIRLSLLVERYVQAALSEQDFFGLTTLAAIDALLARSWRLAGAA
jgi:hypothetical protein